MVQGGDELHPYANTTYITPRGTTKKGIVKHNLHIKYERINKKPSNLEIGGPNVSDAVKLPQHHHFLDMSEISRLNSVDIDAAGNVFSELILTIPQNCLITYGQFVID